MFTEVEDGVFSEVEITSSSTTSTSSTTGSSGSSKGKEANKLTCLILSVVS